MRFSPSLPLWGNFLHLPNRHVLMQAFRPILGSAEISTETPLTHRVLMAYNIIDLFIDCEQPRHILIRLSQELLDASNPRSAGIFE